MKNHSGISHLLDQTVILDSLHHEDVVLSRVYPCGDGVVILDENALFDTPFTYKRYCQKQNEWMLRYPSVHRFLAGDEALETFLGGARGDITRPYNLARTVDRESIVADPSPLEFRFEECFIEAYGEAALKYLKREYAFLTPDGQTVYVDYALFRKDGTWIAIEENGISFHHPLLIGRARYQRILQKQNAVVTSGGVVFRWDTESLSNRQRIVDELREFVGDLGQFVVQFALTSQRGFALHDHQADHLAELADDRSQGKASALVVLPTGTGKTMIALEDMAQLARRQGPLNALILVPSLDLVRQWQRAAEPYGKTIGAIDVLTYAGAARRYFQDAPDRYGYVVVDEAHHAPAPVLKKAIQHYQPHFMLGLTATDKRMDARRLEAIFGSYEEKLDLKEAIEAGLLCPIRAFRLESSLDLSDVRFNGKDYVSADLERRIRVRSRNELIADMLHTYFYERLPGKSGLVFCVNVAHAREMASLLRDRGFTAESVDGGDARRHEKIRQYMDGKIQFLCTCSLLTEGWDAPRTSVIVMARPTLSRVLYMQQLGRGTRKYPGKEALYVIDVVDRYGSFGQVSNRPWTLHALFDQLSYRPFDHVATGPNPPGQELVILDTTHEQAIALQPFEIITMQKLYEDHLSAEALARELFISTGTVNRWVNNGELTPDVSIPMGRTRISLFHPAQVDAIRRAKGLKPHTEETLVEDFHAFIDERSYSFSYKMVFILSLLDTADSTGDADFEALRDRYRHFYLERMEQGKAIDRPNCPYESRAFLEDDRALNRSILSNPFEKFERKRFFYYAKDLKKISIHHRIWEDLSRNNGLEKLRNRMLEDLRTYYEPLGGF